MSNAFGEKAILPDAKKGDLLKMKKFIYLAALAMLFTLTTQSLSSTLGDINADAKIDLSEAIYALQVVAGIKQVTTINRIIGSWIYNPGDLANSGVLTFIDNTNYIFAVDGEPDDGGGRGMERGTYTWDSASGSFTATAISSTLGDWGISDLHIMTISIDEDTLNLNDSVEGLIQFTKIQ